MKGGGDGVISPQTLFPVRKKHGNERVKVVESFSVGKLAQATFKDEPERKHLQVSLCINVYMISL